MSRVFRALTIAAVVTASVSLLAQTPAPPARFQFQRSIIVAGGGPQRLEPDVPVVAGSQVFSVAQRGDSFLASGGLNDLRLYSADGAEIPYLLVPPSLDAPPGPILHAPLAFEVRPAEPGRSRFRISLPGLHLPIVALELTVGGGPLLRDARLLEASLVGDAAQASVIGQARLTRTEREGLAADVLRIPTRVPREPQIELVVDDGDNPALELKSVTAVFAELPWVYFESAPGTITAKYGDPKLPAPHYDLEATRERIPEKPSTAGWGPAPPIVLAPEPEGLPMPETGSTLDPAGFGYVRDIPQGPAGLITIPLDGAVMSRSGVSSRGLRDIRVIDPNSRQVPYLIERRDAPLILEAAIERKGLPDGIEAPAGRQSSYEIKIPFLDLPSARVVLTTRARVFTRNVTFGIVAPAEDRRPARLERTATMTWVHASQDTPAPSIGFALPESRRGPLFVLVEEGDNQPLPIDKATVLLPSYALRLFRRPDSPMRLVYGHDEIDSPRYDLQLLAPQLMGRVATEVTPGPEQAFNATAAPGGAPEVTPAVFWTVLVLAVVVLLVLIARLIRKDADAAKP